MMSLIKRTFLILMIVVALNDFSFGEYGDSVENSLFIVEQSYQLYIPFHKQKTDERDERS